MNFHEEVKLFEDEHWYRDLSLLNASGDYTEMISAILQNYLTEALSPLQYIFVDYCLAMACVGLGNILIGNY